MSEKAIGTRVETLANLSKWMFQAANREDDSGNRQLLMDSGLEHLRAAHVARIVRDAIEEVRKVAIVIQETSSPNSVVATDVRKSLQSIERDLAECLEFAEAV